MKHREVLYWICCWVFLLVTTTLVQGQTLTAEKIEDSIRLYQQHDKVKHQFFIAQLFRTAQKKSSKDILVKAIYYRANFYMDYYHADSAAFFVWQGIDLAKEIDNTNIVVDFLQLYGFIHKNLLRNQDSAQYYFNNALLNSQAQQYALGESKALEALSFLQMDKGEYIEAIDLLLQARHLAYHNVKDSLLIQSLSNNIGHAYMQMEMYEEALPFFEHAYQIKKPIYLISVLNIAECYHKTDQYQKALDILNKEQFLFEKAKPRIYNLYQSQKALLLLASNQPQQALLILNGLQTPSAKQLPELKLSIVKSYLALQDTLNAHQILIKLYPTLLQETKFDILLENHKLLAQTYAYLKNYQQANYHYKNYIDLYEKAYSASAKKKFYANELKQRLAFQQKEREVREANLQLKLEKQQQQQRYTWLGIIFLILIMIAITRAYTLSNKHRKNIQLINQDLRNKQEEIQQQNYQLHEQSEELVRQSEELKSSQEELMTLNNNLENIVEERTEEIIKKNQILEEYAFINAHKLRAPVARILGILELIRLANSTDEFHHYLYLIKQETEDLDRIIWAIKEAIQEDIPLNRWELENRKQNFKHH